jgi:hypothetical protein
MISSIRPFSSSEIRTVTTDNIGGVSDFTLRLDDFFLQLFLAVAISELRRLLRDQHHFFR